MNVQALNTLVVAKPTRFLAAIAALMLSACGGGGGGAAAPEPTVTAMNINPVGGSLQSLMVTITGSNLTQGLSVTSPQCTTLTRSATAPNASDASTAYYQCATTAAAPSVVQVNAARSSDSGLLGSASFAVGAATTVNTALAGEGAGPPDANGRGAVSGVGMYGQPLTVTITGTNVNQGLNVSSPVCTGMTLSTSPPLISSAATAYYRCRVAALGLNQLSVANSSDPANDLVTPRFTVPVPQVTLSMKRAAEPPELLGTVVMNLTPYETPLTVNNFLNYVNSGFYNGTIFDLIAKNPTPTLIVGGSYTPTSGSPPPTPKAANPAIPLELVPGQSNVQWAVAMDHPSSGPNTATSGFYINLVDNLHLDADFAVFGSIAAGPSIDVLNLMATLGCAAVTGFSVCLPGPNIIIESAVQTR